jgi:hypothetical protein
VCLLHAGTRIATRQSPLYRYPECKSTDDTEVSKYEKSKEGISLQTGTAKRARGRRDCDFLCGGGSPGGIRRRETFLAGSSDSGARTIPKFEHRRIGRQPGLPRRTSRAYQHDLCDLLDPSGYAVSANYERLINGFFQNVASATGQTTNVYDGDTQYYDGSGHIAYSSTFGGSYVDTSALPLAGCVDPPTTACVNDSQLQAEIIKDVSAAGWTASPTHEFFMFTGNGIGSCTDITSTECAFTTYCAYHSWTGSGANVVLYANMPYADTSSSTCDGGQHPSGDDADATINVTSHEHNETITDEEGSAWYDSSGNENGDKCAWNFGTPQGPSGAEYNQTINGVHYYLQQEWSNASSGCVLQGT